MRFVEGQGCPEGAKGKLDRWALVRHRDGLVALAGQLAGRNFRTSSVVEMDRNGRWASTVNSLYDLGFHDAAAGLSSARAVDGPSAAWRAVPVPSQPPAAPAGFRTAMGSIYAIGGDGRTTRLKASRGQGQGEVHRPSMALYISSKDSNLLMPLAMAFETLRIGHFDRSTNMFTPFEDEIHRPPGNDLVVAVFDRASGAFLRGFAATAQPGVGLIPVEKAYEVGPDGDMVGYTHVGNPIVELLDAGTLHEALAASMPVTEAGPAPR